MKNIVRDLLLSFSVAFILQEAYGQLAGLFEGDKCTKLDKVGTCVHVQNCKSAQEEIKNRIYPKICSIDGKDPIVCCFDSNNFTEIEVPAPTFASIEKSTKPTLVSVENATSAPNSPNKLTLGLDNRRDNKPVGCGNIPEKYTTNKTGKVAWDKCFEYQRKLRPVPYYLVERNNTVVTGSNGEDADIYEFSHMALLGYGNNENDLQWLCGGTIISEKFVLTAAHCTVTSRGGNVSIVGTGVHKKSDLYLNRHARRVKNIINHPEYKPPSKYNDIALLEVQKEMKLNEFLTPACLHTGEYESKSQYAVATGWGAVSYQGDTPDVLQKMKIKRFSKESCIELFQPYRLLKRGFDDATQLCYGDPVENTDTCDGDSGGPLQIDHPGNLCMHLVIGVTSFGDRCGQVNKPSVYTRVEPYVPWIESVVWPEEFFKQGS